MSKGSTRRPEDTKAIAANWPFKEEEQGLWREVYSGGWHLVECNGRQHRIRSHARLVDGSIGPVKRHYNCDCAMYATRDTSTSDNNARAREESCHSGGTEMQPGERINPPLQVIGGHLKCGDS